MRTKVLYICLLPPHLCCYLFVVVVARGGEEPRRIIQWMCWPASQAQLSKGRIGSPSPSEMSATASPASALPFRAGKSACATEAHRARSPPPTVPERRRAASLEGDAPLLTSHDRDALRPRPTPRPTRRTSRTARTIRRPLAFRGRRGWGEE
uniref:Secreted protein n=2 Tax=Oryza nivara TaxID=4536 RepID=A0A0E0H2H7_ORYNI